MKFNGLGRLQRYVKKGVSRFTGNPPGDADACDMPSVGRVVKLRTALTPFCPTHAR